MNKQQRINRMLKGVKCSFSPWNSYGMWLKINAFVAMVCSDFVIPSFRLITVVAIKYKPALEKIEFCRVTIHNR